MYILLSLYILNLRVLGKTGMPPSPRHEHNDEKNLFENQFKKWCTNLNSGHHFYDI